MEKIRLILYVGLRRRNPHHDLPVVMVKIPGLWSQLRLEQPGSRHAVLKDRFMNNMAICVGQTDLFRTMKAH